MFISFIKQFSYDMIYMNGEENNILILQYIRLVARQNQGILNALETMQRQHENFSHVLSEELRDRRETRNRNRNTILTRNNAGSSTRNNTGSTTRNNADSSTRNNAGSTTRNNASAYSTRNSTTTNINNILTRSRNQSLYSESSLTSLFNSRRLPRVRTNFSNPTIVTHHRDSNPLSNNLPNYVSESTNTVDEDTLNATLHDSPIRIRASFNQISRATRLMPFRDISSNNETICPIDREILHDTDNVLQILECRHYFREANLRRHFRNSPRCPLCRYDIRDYIPDYYELQNIVPPPPPPPRTSNVQPPPSPPNSLFSLSSLSEEEDEEGPPPFYLNTPPDIEDPFTTRPSANINPSIQTTNELNMDNNLSDNEMNV